LFRRFKMNSRLEILTAPLSNLSFPQRLTVRLILLTFFGFYRVENSEKLNCSDEPVIFVFNHNNSLETLLLAAFLMFRRGRTVSFVVDWIFAFLPVIGWFVRQVEPVLVYNKKAKIAFFNRFKNRAAASETWRECVAKLDAQHSLAIFPEGARNKNAFQLKRARAGVGKIALAAQVPIVPIGIDFPARLKRGKIPRFGSLILRIGDRLNFAAETKIIRQINDSELPAKEKQKWLAYLDKRVTHRAMLEIARLSGKTYPFNPPTAPMPSADLFLRQNKIRRRQKQ
jgi:1-acyl-sn-glycerol-3-phosphate acyltransferase